MEEKFIEYLKQARKDFAEVVVKYPVRFNLELRTSIDSFLIAYDQSVSKVFETEEANEKLDEIEFFDLMQSYRIAEITDQGKVVDKLEAVKSWIRQNYKN